MTFSEATAPNNNVGNTFEIIKYILYGFAYVRIKVPEKKGITC